VVVGAAWLAAASAPAIAQSRGRAVLRWSAPAGCPTEAVVQRELAARLGERSGVAVEAQATVEQSPRGYRLRLETSTEGRSALRELEASACQELADAAEIIVALMVDPSSVAPEEAEQLGTGAADAVDAGVGSSPSERELAEPGADAEQQSEAEPEEPEEPERDAEQEDTDDHDQGEEAEHDAPGPPLRVSFVVRAGAVLDAGSLPEPALGPALGVGVRLDRVELAAGGVWLPAQDVSSPRRSGRVAVLQLLGARASLCYRALGVLGTERELMFAACLSGELGRTWGRGTDIAQSEHAEATWAAGFLALQAEWPLAGALGLYGELSAGLPLLRTTFRVQDVGTVHEEGPLLGRVSLGLVLSP
jgi:hypothetical protein